MSAPIVSDLNLQGNKVNNLGNGTASGDAVNYGQLSAAVVSQGKFLGSFDASSGLVPATGSGTAGAIVAGDRWRITVAGTISGVTPIAVLSVGDMLESNQDGANTGSQFHAYQGNLLDANIPNMARGTVTGNGSATTLAYVHGLALTSPYNLSVSVRERTTGTEIMVENAPTSGSEANSIDLKFGSAPANLFVFDVLAIG